MTAEEVDVILPSGRVIARRPSSSSLFNKFRRSSSSSASLSAAASGGVSDTSTHSVQSMQSMQSSSKSKLKEKKEQQEDKEEKKERRKPTSSHDEHEYAYLYDLIDTSSDGKLSTTEFVRALKTNSSVAEVRKSCLLDDVDVYSALYFHFLIQVYNF